jgi:hypothetical protein
MSVSGGARCRIKLIVRGKRSVVFPKLNHTPLRQS